MSYNMYVLCFLCMSVLMLVLLFTCMSVLKALQSLCCMFYTPTLNKICICQIYDFERVLLEILGSWSFFLSIPRDNLLL